MNEQLRPASLPLTTQAAEGLPRRRWTVAEIEQMVAKGIIDEDERFELIGGHHQQEGEAEDHARHGLWGTRALLSACPPWA